jgi:hypothetical protein
VQFARLGPLILLTIGLLLSRTSRAEETSVRTIVFVAPAAPDIEASLRDALTAQLSGVSVNLVFESFATHDAPLRAQVSEARSLAAAHLALAVFWLDVQASSDKDWLIYLAEPTGSRVLVRRVPLHAEGTAASVEAVAVITRESTEALLAGQTIGMEAIASASAPSGPVSEPPLVSPVVVPPAQRVDRRSGLDLSMGYYGDAYAHQVWWQSGIALGGAYHFDSGLLLGLGLVVFNDVSVSTPDVAFRVTRVPIRAAVGYRTNWRRFAFGFELRAGVEITSRHDITTDTTLTGSGDSARAVLLLSPRLRVEYRLTSVLSVYLAAGGDIGLNQFSYVSRTDGRDLVELDPLKIRPSGELGVAFWP